MVDVIGLSTVITKLEEIFFFTNTFGQSWLFYLTVLFATMIIITRRWSHWNSIALPVMVGWKYYGMPIPTVFLVIASLLFIIDIMSLSIITGAFSGLGELATSKGRRLAMTRRINYKAEVRKLREIAPRNKLSTWTSGKTKYQTENEMVEKEERANMLQRASQARSDRRVQEIDHEQKIKQADVRGLNAAEIEAQYARELESSFKESEISELGTNVRFEKKHRLEKTTGDKIDKDMWETSMARGAAEDRYEKRVPLREIARYNMQTEAITAASKRAIASSRRVVEGEKKGQKRAIGTKFISRVMPGLRFDEEEPKVKSYLDDVHESSFNNKRKEKKEEKKKKKKERRIRARARN